MVPEGCNLGYEAACNECFHVASIKKGADNLYHVDDYIVRISSWRNSQTLQGFERCPRGYQKGNKYQSCYKYCYNNAPEKCARGDVLKDKSSGKVIGFVIDNFGSKLGISSLDYSYNTWDNAKKWAESYVPEGLESDDNFKSGKWYLPNSNLNPVSMYPSDAYFGICYAEKSAYNNGTWLSENEGVVASYKPFGDGIRSYNKSSKMYVNAVTMWQFK